MTKRFSHSKVDLALSEFENFTFVFEKVFESKFLDFSDPYYWTEARCFVSKFLLERSMFGILDGRKASRKSRKSSFPGRSPAPIHRPKVFKWNRSPSCSTSENGWAGVGPRRSSSIRPRRPQQPSIRSSGVIAAP